MKSGEWDEIAESYYDEVISPFQQKVKNPLYSEIKKIRNKKKKVIAEFGCGYFVLGEFLSKKFKKVYATDFSLKMVKMAREKCSELKNVVVKKEKMVRMKHINKFDVVLSINSLLMPSFKEIKRALKNINNSLKEDGVCFIIVPSMESLLYHGLLVLNSELKRTRENTAKRRVKEKLGLKKMDFLFGYFREGKYKQKFFYLHELKYLFRKAGFKNISISKVEYSWKSDIGDYERFPKEEKLWDWFVKATK
ncbi:MAG: class I SAM-dependent methyltransferase [Candidatus Woesearchaeota archaeon]